MENAVNPSPDVRTRSLQAVVIGASAGGVEALLALLSFLPAGFQLPLVVVLHLPDIRESQLTAIFSRRSSMAVREVMDKEEVAPATLYFAAPGYHLSIETDHTFSLSCEAPVHFSRPSIDMLMESAADAYSDRLLGIVLTGANVDGAAGLAKIHRRGGITVVQDPQEAKVAIMPEAAIRQHLPDFILKLEDIRSLLIQLDKNTCSPANLPTS